jgi:tetratricopeptide (TPR) repeat protein
MRRPDMSPASLPVLLPALVVAVAMATGTAFAYGNDYDVGDCVEPFPDHAVAPRFSGLGDHRYPILTHGPQARRAQTYFDQGITLLYAFNHPEAIHSFAQAAADDPAATMAHWGIAMAAGPDINTGATQACFELAMAAIETAVRTAEASLRAATGDRPQAEREHAYATALRERYRRDGNGDIAVDERAYADAMQAVSQRYPDDLDAATLYAAALMNVDAWRWWVDGEATPEAAVAQAVLRDVLGRDPDHLGANHYFIHATEESPTPEDALAAAERLAALAPASGHIVHMPSHIYRRVGEHARATASNYAAVAADLAYIRQTPATARYPLHYLSHNLHFLTVSLTIEGRESEALAAARQLFENALRWGDDLYNHLHNQTLVDVKEDLFFTVPIETIARFRRWDALLLAEIEEELAAPSSPRIPFTRVMWRYADALEYLDVGPVDAHGAGARLDAFRAAADGISRDLTHGNNSADDLFRIAHLVLLARAVEAVPAGESAGFIDAAAAATAGSHALGRDADLLDERGGHALIVALLRRAVAREDALDYNEPPDWYFPVREALGAALWRQEKFADAEAVFRQDLEINRGNGRSLFGLIESLRAQGKPVPGWLEAQFEKAWRNATVELSLDTM